MSAVVTITITITVDGGAVAVSAPQITETQELRPAAGVAGTAATVTGPGSAPASFSDATPQGRVVGGSGLVLPDPVVPPGTTSQAAGGQIPVVTPAPTVGIGDRHPSDANGCGQLVCVVDQGEPCPSTCVLEGRCAWAPDAPGPQDPIPAGDEPANAGGSHDQGLDHGEPTDTGIGAGRYLQKMQTTPDCTQAQHESWVRAELAFGSDADEAEYRRRLREADDLRMQAFLRRGEA